MQHVYVVGSKGLPGSYGGYETFLDKLTEYHQFNRNIQYHVACKANGDGVSPELMAMPDHFNYHKNFSKNNSRNVFTQLIISRA